MSDSMSDDDDDLNELLSFDPFSKEKRVVTNSDDNCIVEEPFGEGEGDCSTKQDETKALGDSSIDVIGE